MICVGSTSQQYTRHCREREREKKVEDSSERNRKEIRELENHACSSAREEGLGKRGEAKTANCNVGFVLGTKGTFPGNKKE